MSNQSTTPIILLKTKSSPSDSYDEVFSREGYRPFFVPVLEHVFTSQGLEFLKDCICDGSFSSDQPSQNTKQYGGLIFTSQRAVEAFSKVIWDLRKDDVNIDHLVAPNLPIYVVGPATAKGLRALNLPCSVFGEHTGNGDALAEFILDHYNQLPTSLDKTGPLAKPGLLFVVGEQRRDIIPRTLQSDTLSPGQRIDIDEITVYETAVMQSFAEDFATVIQSNNQHRSVQWIVVFSPTGCKVMLSGLGLLDPNTGKANDQAKDPQRRTLIATIGPTTRNYLLREFEFEPDVCSAAPSPDGLKGSISDFRDRHLDLFAK